MTLDEQKLRDAGKGLALDIMVAYLLAKMAESNPALLHEVHQSLVARVQTGIEDIAERHPECSQDGFLLMAAGATTMLDRTFASALGLCKGLQE